MLKNLLKFSLFLTPVVAFGQSKYNMDAASIVENYRNAVKVSAADAKASEQPVTLMVTVASPAALDEIKALGVEVKRFRADVAIVRATPSQMESMAALESVVSIDKGGKQQPMMYFARSVANADPVLDGSGAGLTKAYRGAGVVAGLMDQGLDPNHVAFQNADQTANRVKQVYYYMTEGVAGEPSASYITPEEIANAATDYSGWTHGTHVCSIMAGGYNGPSTFGLNGRVQENQPMPYYGLASDADIVMTGGIFYDDNILDGVERVIDYAKSVNKPAVVNLSLGYTVGPHDGSSAICRYLAGLGEDAIICVAAGNDAEKKCAWNPSFNRISTEAITGISMTTPGEAVTAEFWYNLEDAFGFSFMLYNMNTGKFTEYELPAAGETYKIDTSDETFAKAFVRGSQVQVYANVDPVNKRYYVRMRMAAISANQAYVPCVKVSGKNRASILATISNGQFETLGIPGASSGSANGSISDMATGSNIIVAGAYTSAKSFSVASGGSLSFQGATDRNQLCTFSSWGTTFQGVNLPDLCAPGSAIIAAVNSYNFVSPSADNYTATTTFKGKNNYWAVMQGTSMACPFIAGTVALMLEADPTLTVDRARNILTSTAVAPPSSAPSDEKIQWGAGRIDVLAAVKKTIEEAASVENVFADDSKNFILTAADGGYSVFVAGENGFTVYLYDTAGLHVGSFAADGNTAMVDTRSLQSGVYVLAVRGTSQTHTAKIAVK